MRQQIKHFYEFGPFRLDAAERQLWHADELVPLTPKAFDLLQALVEQQGHLIDKEQLLKAVWPDAFVEEANLSHNISQIRRILGDGENGQRYIETVPKRGYRFVGAVREGRQELTDRSDGLDQFLHLDEGILAGGVSLGERQFTESSTAAPGPKRKLKLGWAALLLALAALLTGLVWLVQSPGTTTRQSWLLPIPLTTYPGWEFAPSFSPDGKQIAFAWNGEKQDNFDIYVKLIGTEGQIRLTNHPDHEGGPAWSPDGRWIAFERLVTASKVAVMLKPAIGGVERTLAELHFSGLVSRRYFFSRDLAWHPSGKWLAVSDRVTAEGATCALFLLSTETSEKRRLTSPTSELLGDHSPAFSPDGLHLAFSRSASGHSTSQLYMLTLAEDLAPQGEPKRLGIENRRNGGPVWSSDGREILFTSGPQHRIGLWRTAAFGIHEPERLTFAMEGAGLPAISRQGNRLAYVNLAFDVNIWQLGLTGRGNVAGPAVNLISSTRIDHTPKFSPDGKKILFSSFRSGTPEIWACNADGSSPVQLTTLEATVAQNPRWSPDGRQIVFDSTIQGNADVYVISAEGGKPRRLTDSAASDSGASFSRDGRWIYFSSDRGGEVRIWRMPGNGGEVLQVTKTGGQLPVESLDGKVLYYLKGRQPRDSLWRVTLADGEERQVIESVYAQNFEVVNDGIYFIPQADQQGRYAIHFLNSASGKTQPIAPISKDVMYGFAVSPDEKTILYTQVDQEGSDLMLVENFR